jgi:hypothetical protein
LILCTRFVLCSSIDYYFRTRLNIGLSRQNGGWAEWLCFTPENKWSSVAKANAEEREEEEKQLLVAFDSDLTVCQLHDIEDHSKLYFIITGLTEDITFHK